ncbi:MAG: sigma-70 family RNA polymerase sigma factor [Candidatus Aminicenantes bacterium]|nr:sigma-70 family RNA polymerase sigma factor [Candidatus Aminicenantes bacterium]
MSGQRDDRQLIAQAAAGDRQAFAELVRRHQGWVLQLTYRYTRDRQDAEELGQEIFFKAWRSASSFRGESAFSTWLYRLAVNACLNHRQKIKARPVPVSLAGDPEGGEPQTTDVLVVAEREALLREAMSALPARQRLALALASFEDKSYEEIAEVMDVSVASVESLLFRARRKLAAALRPLRSRGEL